MGNTGTMADPTTSSMPNLKSLLPDDGTDWDLLSSYGGLLGLACVSIYCGAYGSLGKEKKGKGKKGKGKDKESDRESEDDDDDEDDEEDIELVSMEDAWWFPIIGSVVLFGLFLVIKYIGKEWINWLLGWYFSFAGVGSVSRSAISLAKFIIGREQWKQFERIEMKVTKGKPGRVKGGKEGEKREKKPRHDTLVSLSWRTPSTFILALSMIPSVLYKMSSAGRRSVLLTDILAMSFSHNALSLIKLDSFATGCALLSGLFVYDIWWVFGTRVMVEVATGLDVPIKLLWPKSLEFSGARGFTMLGLGDIVVPGTFIALALRFDLRNGRKGKTPWFFYGTLTAYVLGLVTTMTVMHVWGHAQPALLYLSPGCMGGFVLTGVLRGELMEAWKWKS
ncbi:hypothetical protein V5O48_000695 [Marasmius crinis-equi]|uniref:Peptidase A22B, signal peptide peptidase n=1 Tax=Marasmius crinis-equi TaxID=585013 RepID=A0ABR3G0V5_9AGAR